MSEVPEPKPPTSSITSRFVDEFIAWEDENRHIHGGITPSTEKSYREALLIFRRWLKNNSKTILTAERRDFMSFRTYLESNYKGATPKHRIGILKRFYYWMELDGKIEFSPVPALLTSSGSKGKPSLIPTPENIFKIRSQKRIRIERAMAFEMILSTGMRADEFKQVRVCDIEFDKRPVDTEIKKKSPFYVGSIYLDEDKMDIKNNTSHRVWINRIAMRMLIQWMNKYKIETSSDIPLFALSDSCFSKWFVELGECVYGNKKDDNNDGNSKEEKFEIRNRNLSDIDIKSLLSIDPRMRKKIEKKQKENHNGIIAKEKKKEKRKKRVLHPHALRHSFTCINYYRNPYGERKQSDRLRVLLGHNAFATTFAYLKNLDLVETNRTWMQLQTGKPEDWERAK